MTFESFQFKPALLKAILEEGYETPTPIQEQTIPLLLEGQDVIGCAQTGTGKTAAFSLPILEKLKGGKKNPQALIITPTRELAEQIYQNIKNYSRHIKKMTCLAVYGGVKIQPQITRLSKGVDILIATPGRLMDHLRQKNLSLNYIKFFVLDEADRMLDMGFLPDIEHLMRHIPDERQSLLFSATMPSSIEHLAHSLTKDAQTIMVAARNMAADKVEQTVHHVLKRDKMRMLFYLFANYDMESVIIFSRTKHGADRITERLTRKGINAVPIHSDRTQAQRQEALKGFQDGKYRVMVATDIAARGIDVQGISHVINYDTPEYAEDYVHRIGRTGRADAHGEAWTFAAPEDEKFLSNIEQMIGKRINVAPTVYLPDEYMSPRQRYQKDERQRNGRSRDRNSREGRGRDDRSRNDRPRNDRPRDDRPRDDRPRRKVLSRTELEAKSSVVRSKVSVSKKGKTETPKSKITVKTSQKTRAKTKLPSQGKRSEETGPKSVSVQKSDESKGRIKVKSRLKSKETARPPRSSASSSRSSGGASRSSAGSKSSKNNRNNNSSKHEPFVPQAELIKPEYHEPGYDANSPKKKKREETGPITMASVEAIPLYLTAPKNIPVSSSETLFGEGIVYAEDLDENGIEVPKTQESQVYQPEKVHTRTRFRKRVPSRKRGR